jgi:hypothetical protein
LNVAAGLRACRFERSLSTGIRKNRKQRRPPRDVAHLLVLVTQFLNPPDPAGAEARRYSENGQFIFASSAAFFAATVLFEVH